MSYPSDLTGDQWVLVEPLLVRPGKPGRRHADLRTVVNSVFSITHTGCRWRFVLAEFGPWTRVWSQFRRWNRTGTWHGHWPPCTRRPAGLRVRRHLTAGEQISEQP